MHRNYAARAASDDFFRRVNIGPAAAAAAAALSLASVITFTHALCLLSASTHSSGPAWRVWGGIVCVLGGWDVRAAGGASGGHSQGSDVILHTMRPIVVQ